MLLIIIAGFTAFMAYEASKVQLSYDFTSAIPTDNPKYKDYKQFQEMFGNDGNTMMLGIQSKIFLKPVF